MKAVAFIFARGGSKGLPGKNIRDFGGRPLIAWSIKHALSVDSIERVIVSTDSKEIADVALKYGAEVPFMRPESLAHDSSPEWLSWKHAINYLKLNGKPLPEIMISLPATAPLRSPLDIEACINEYKKGHADVVITITESHRSPYFNMVKRDVESTVSLVIPPVGKIHRRQDVPVTFDVGTVAYVANINYVLASDGLFDGRVGAVEVPRERSVDIDTLFDFQIAEYLLTLRNQ
jgi:CMP-N-acetylneuraminic acid synthetase